MVAAETFASLNIHDIVIDMMGNEKDPCLINGADAYPGMGMTWETGGYDVDPAEDDDKAWAGIVGNPSDHDLDTIFANNDPSFMCGPGSKAYALFVASGGALVKGEPLGVDGTADGYLVALTGAGLLPRASFLKDSDGNFYHADVAAVCIIGVKVLHGGTVALV